VVRDDAAPSRPRGLGQGAAEARSLNQDGDPEQRHEDEDPVVTVVSALVIVQEGGSVGHRGRLRYRASEPGRDGKGAQDGDGDDDSTHSALLPDGRSAFALRQAAIFAQAGCAGSDIAARATPLHGGAGCVTV
jgi:hypothetical protein